MKNTINLLAAIVLALLPSAARSAATPSIALMPYTYVGRVVDSTYAAFDGDNAVQLRLKDLSGKLLAKCTTYSSSTSPYNYRLDVPMSSAPASGCATNGQLVVVEVIDSMGSTWTGLIPPSKSRIGRAGGLCRCNIVVAEDDNGNGVADDYEDYMYWKMWENGIDGEFDPDADYDGDGQSNFAEYVAGTDPFDAADKLGFTMLARDPADDEEVFRLTFLASAGRVYRVRESATLGKGAEWQEGSFKVDPNVDATVKRLATGSNEEGYRTIYIMRKKGATSGFYRLDVE